jgi:hypothetical protein
MIRLFFSSFIFAALTSCVSQNDIATIQQYTDRGLCSNWASIPSSHRLNSYYESEIRTRRLNCAASHVTLKNKRNREDYERGQRVAAALMGIGAAISNGANTQSQYLPTDSDWDWDAFYDGYGNLLWRCRGIQSGQFANNSNCQYDYMDDDRWPNK